MGARGPKAEESRVEDALFWLDWHRRVGEAVRMNPKKGRPKRYGPVEWPDGLLRGLYELRESERGR
jgi:hypothetical protein